MKRNLFAFIVFISLSGFMYAQTSLDQALVDAAQQLSERLEKGSTVAVMQIRSPAGQLSDYVIDELNNHIVNTGALIAVDRHQLDLIRGEIDFNDTDEVSQQSQQQVGRMLGARSIITGSLNDVAGSYRLVLRALSVENAAIQASVSLNVDKNDRIVQNFIREASGIVQDYTTNERAKIAGLNILFGTGSFMERDIFGGGITAGVEGTGLALMLIGIIDKTLSEDEMGEEAEIRDNILTFGGAGIMAGGIVFGIIRGFTYHRPGSSVSFVNPNNWNLAILPDRNGNATVQMSYTLRF
ncbi:MAG: P13 family porin [Treponema sp.]|jgi:hypothetical protein|nr:P13 family porin [Treponema sp.]